MATAGTVVSMSDNTPTWRNQAPKGMHAVIYARRCGWHVLLHETGTTVRERLTPVLLGKSCVPYKPDAEHARQQDQAEALAIGLYNIAMDAPEFCNSL